MFALTCSGYGHGDDIPGRFAHHSIGGKNVSPAFAWQEPPVVTKSFAFSVIDPHPVARNWVHWIAINIPFSAREIPEGASCSDRMPKGARELMNTYGERGFGGPGPPAGSGRHPYVATLYALNVEKLQLPNDASLRQFLKAVEGKIIQEVSLTGYYEVP